MATILSSDGKRFYQVNHHSCTCPNYVYRQAQHGLKCKHIIKHFFPKEVINEEQIEFEQNKSIFEGGVHNHIALLKFGEEKISLWLKNNFICELNQQFYLLE